MPQPPPRSTLFPYTTLFRSISESPLIVLKNDKTNKNITSTYLDTSSEFKISILIFINPFWQSTRPTKEKERSEEHTSELQSRRDLVCRLLLEKKKRTNTWIR